MPDEQKTFETAAKNYPLYGEARQDVSSWCADICRLREFFRETAIGVGKKDAPELWMVLFAKQSPREVTFLQLRRRPTALDVRDRAAGVTTPARRDYDWYPPVVRTENDFQDIDDSALWVHRNLKVVGLIVVSPHEAEFFAGFRNAACCKAALESETSWRCGEKNSSGRVSVAVGR